jgi:toxin ParE1/3/4
MTGGLNFTPEAERQLNELDDWITKRASPDIAQRFVSAILDHIETIPAFPYAGRARRRPARNAADHFKNRTLVAYEADESSGELVVNILGVFHGGQDWEAALGEDQVDGDSEAGR